MAEPLVRLVVGVQGDAGQRRVAAALAAIACECKGSFAPFTPVRRVQIVLAVPASARAARPPTKEEQDTPDDHGGQCHEDVVLDCAEAVVEGAFLLGVAPKNFVVAVAVEGRVDVDEVNAGTGEVAQLLEVVAAVDELGLDH